MESNLVELTWWGSVAHGATPSCFVSYCGQDTYLAFRSPAKWCALFFRSELFRADRRYQMSKLSFGGKTREAQGQQQKAESGRRNLWESAALGLHNLCMLEWLIYSIHKLPSYQECSKANTPILQSLLPQSTRGILSPPLVLCTKHYSLPYIWPISSSYLQHNKPRVTQDWTTVTNVTISSWEYLQYWRRDTG